MKTKSQQFASQAWGCNAKVRQLLNFSKKAKKVKRIKKVRISLTKSSIPTNSGCRKPIITVFCTCWKRWASAARCAWRENAIQNSQRVKPNSLNYSPCRLPTKRWRSNSTDHWLTGPLPCWRTWSICHMCEDRNKRGRIDFPCYDIVWDCWGFGTLFVESTLCRSWPLIHKLSVNCE